MKLKINDARVVLVLGITFFIYGAFSSIADLTSIWQTSRFYDLGIGLAHLSFTAVGWVAIQVSRGLKNLEERLNRIEKIQLPSHKSESSTG